MAEGLPEFRDVAAAAARLAGLVVTTPLVSHPLLDEITGGRIFLKAEPLQRTGSFKFRGATNAVLRLPAAARAAGIVTYSSGNHGQAVAAAAAAGIAASVFMPADAPAIKRASTASWGAEIRLYDRAREDREALALAFAEARGAAIIPPFDHPDVIAGQGTLALEIFAECRARGVSPEALLVCTGGGGLIAGSALALEGASPATRVWCVEPEGWDDTRRSLAAGERVANAPPGGPALCDALLSPMPGALTFAVNRRLLAGGVAVSEAEVLAAMAFAFRHLKLVVEPGGAVALAALLAGKFDARGKVVGAVLSGGNVDPAVFARALAA